MQNPPLAAENDYELHQSIPLTPYNAFKGQVLLEKNIEGNAILKIVSENHKEMLINSDGEQVSQIDIPLPDQQILGNCIISVDWRDMFGDIFTLKITIENPKNPSIKVESSPKVYEQ